MDYRVIPDHHRGLSRKYRLQYFDSYCKSWFSCLVAVQYVWEAPKWSGYPVSVPVEGFTATEDLEATFGGLTDAAIADIKSHCASVKDVVHCLYAAAHAWEAVRRMS